MEVIQSFQVDHTNLKPGIYISRCDRTYWGVFTTFDLRMIEPNKEPALAPAAAHTIEHLLATYLRNDEFWKSRVVYAGPMGCLTGFYVIFAGEVSVQEIKNLILNAFRFISHYEGEVPGATASQCGNYLMHDLPMAKWEAERYFHRLLSDFHCEYSKLEREDINGLEFHDA